MSGGVLVVANMVDFRGVFRPTGGVSQIHMSEITLDWEGVQG